MDTAKKTNLAKIALALLLAMMLSVFVSLGASATSDNRSFYFTTVNSTGQALINKAAQKDNTTSIYCQIQQTSNSTVTYAYDTRLCIQSSTYLECAIGNLVFGAKCT